MDTMTNRNIQATINGECEVQIELSAIGANRAWFYRDNLQDIERLAESMAGPNGQLQAIVVDRNMNLVFGARRIAAAKSLGWSQIRARVIDLADPLAAIQDENGCRVDFLPSEKVRLASMIEDDEREKAKQRMRAGGLEKISHPPETKGRAKDKAANAVGWSRPTLEKARAIIDAARYNPVVQAIVAVMDETGNVSAAYQQFEASGWRFRPLHNYVAEIETNGVPWLVIVSFECAQNGISYFHSVFVELLDRENQANKGGSVSTRAIAGWAVYRILKGHFPESVVREIEWHENDENWIADYVHCFSCGGKGKGGHGRNTDAICERCEGNGTVPKDQSKRK